MATKKEQAERTRALIIKQAIKLFSRQGFAPTSTQDLARAIGMTTGTLYWHFKDKEDLLIAVITALERQLSQQLAVAGDDLAPTGAAQTLEALIARVASVVEHHQEQLLLVGVIGAEATDTNPRVEKALRTAYDRFSTLTRSLLEEAQQEGLIAADVDTACAAQMFIGMYMGGVMHQRLYRAEFPLPQALPVLRQLLLASLVGQPAPAKRKAKPAARRPERRTPA